jgi:hypothetical protein
MFDLTLDGAVARLRLDRPEARNAVPAGAWALLAQRCGEAARSGARLLILSGTRQAFCAGADLADFPGFTTDPASTTAFRQTMRGGLDALRDLPLATIARRRGALLRRRGGPRHGLRHPHRRGGARASRSLRPSSESPIRRRTSPASSPWSALGQASRLLLGAGTVDFEERRGSAWSSLPARRSKRRSTSSPERSSPTAPRASPS